MSLRGRGRVRELVFAATHLLLFIRLLLHRLLTGRHSLKVSVRGFLL